jgi:hypothetical protein
MKARFAAALDPDTIGRAIFTPSDAGPPIEVIAILVRIDNDGQALCSSASPPATSRGSES